MKQGRFLLLTLMSVSMAMSCAKKKAEKVDETTAPADAGTAPTLRLVGVPKDPSSDTTTNIRVATWGGDLSKEYKFALLSGATSCDGATYSAFTAVANPIKEAIGDDGAKLLCVIGKNAKGKESAAATSVSWTKDSTAPTVTISTASAISPYTTSGDTTSLAGTATDATTVERIAVSVQRGSGLCLNDEATGFTATCPNYLGATGTTTWALSAADSAFNDGETYTMSVSASDIAGNISASATTSTFTWKSVAPYPASGLTATVGQAQLKLNWTASSNATGYILVRRSGSAVSTAPTPAATYVAADTIDTGTVVYVGTATTFTDSSLTVDTTYHYAVYGYDDAKNYSSAVTTSAAPKPRYFGLENVFVTGPGRIATAFWQLVDDGINAASSYTYNVFTSSTTAGQDYSSAAATSSAGANSVSLTIGGSGTAYLTARASSSDTNAISDSNTREQTLTFASATQHKIAGNVRYAGQTPFEVFLDSPIGSTVDNWGNSLFSANRSIVYVHCIETTSAAYCRGRQPGAVYAIWGGDGGKADAADASSPFERIGNIGALAVDSLGNVYVGDVTYSRIRVLCFNTGSSAGACNGKTAGKSYNIIGTGSSGNPTDDSTASTAAIGTVYGMDVNSAGNVFFLDISYYKVAAVCYDTSSGYCSGKTAGKMYVVAGTGASADGATDTTATSAAFGYAYGMAIDAYDNVFFSDSTYYRIRAVCNSTSGYCTSKTSGKSYRVAGDATTTDGSSGIDASTAAIGTPYGVTVDSQGTIFFSDSTNYRIRAVCVTSSATVGFCKGKTSGYAYHVAGLGVAKDSDSGGLTEQAIGYAFTLGIDGDQNLIMPDYTFDRIRVLCVSETATLNCADRQQSSIWRLAGSGTSSSYSYSSPQRALFTRFYSPTSFALDTAGNLYYVDSSQYYIFAICFNTTTSSSYCYGKTAGMRYTVFGTGSGTGTDTADDITATGHALQYSTQTIAIDGYNNIFYFDPYRYRVRAICLNTSGGFCASKTTGKVYRMAGTGSSGDGADDTVATSAALGDSYSMKFDSNNNLFISDRTNYRVRVICTGTSGYCSGKTSGKSYQVAGTGSSGDAADDSVVASTIGDVYSMTIDSSDNVYIFESGNYRIRAICNNTTGGYCSAKTAGKMFRLSAGSFGDSASGTAMGSAGVGLIYSMAFDKYGNLMLADGTYRKIRAICFTVAASSGFCSSKTANTMYHVGGTDSGDSNSNETFGTTTGLGYPSTGGFVINTTTNDMFYDDRQYGTLRYIVGY